MDCDTRVLQLINAINNLPGINTFASCGGHENPDKTQHPNGTFYVCFEVAPNKRGFQSLERIVNACDIDLFNLKVTAWSNGGLLQFEIEGNNHTDPDVLADAITRHYCNP